MRYLHINRILFVGHMCVTIPAILSMLIGLFIQFAIAFLLDYNKLVFLFGLVIPFGLSALVTSILVVPWKIWALKRARNAKELLRKGQRHKLLYPPDSFYSKLEIKSKSQKKELERLYKRFEESY